ncbi:MAG: porin [Leptothrix sp. (in: b-proteobacteria)]
MKKSLIALAVLASAGAYAQSSVSLTGTIDAGMKRAIDQNPTKSFTGLTNNNTATSLLYFKGTEDMGFAKAGFLLELDFNPVSGSTANTAPGASTVYNGTPFNGEQFVSLAGAFGEVKLGQPNAAALTAGTTAQPFGTALGGGYSGGFGRLGTAGSDGILNYVGNGSARIVRHEKTTQYSTPSFAGVKATLEYAVQNDSAAGPSASNTNRYTSIAVAYNQGPVNAILVSAKAAAGAQAAEGTTAPNVTVAAANALAVNTSVTTNMLAANYNFGPVIAYAGFTTTKNSVSTTEDSRSMNLAVKVPVTGSIDLMANYLKRDSKLAANADAKLLGLGVDYKLSARTTVYARYEGLDTNTNDGASGELKTTALGLKHTF